MYPAYGLAPEGRVARFRENLAIIKRLWTEDKVTLDGRFSHLESIPMEPKPVQKPLPLIWFGGHAEAALRRAVELGDGYIGAGSTPMDVFVEDIKQLPPNFPKAKRLYLALGDNLPRLRVVWGVLRQARNGRSIGGMGITTANCRPDRAPQRCRREPCLAKPRFR